MQYMQIARNRTGNMHKIIPMLSVKIASFDFGKRHRLETFELITFYFMRTNKEDRVFDRIVHLSVYPTFQDNLQSWKEPLLFSKAAPFKVTV